MTPIQLAAVCSLSSIAFVSTAGWIYIFRALRRSKENSAAQSSELGQVTLKLSKADNELTDVREKHRQSEAELSVVKSELGQVTSKLSGAENELTDLREKHKQSEDELAIVKTDLGNTQGKLKRFRDFIDSLEPLFLQLAREAGDGHGRSEFWRKTAIDFLAELKAQDAAKKAEATLDFILTAADTAVSHVIPHPSPIGCF